MTINTAGTSAKKCRPETGGKRPNSTTEVAGGLLGPDPWPEPAGVLLDLVTGTATESDCLRRLANAAMAALSPVMGQRTDCAVMLASPRRMHLIASTNPRVTGLAALEQDREDGPMARALAERNPVSLQGPEDLPGWTAYWRRLLNAGYGKVLAVPLRMTDGTSSALAFFAPLEAPFAPDAVSRAESFARIGGPSLKLALEVLNVRAAGDNLKTVLESRSSIDVACGVIMGKNHCSYPDAFSLLAGASSRRSKHVREVAEGVVKNLRRLAPGTRLTLDSVGLPGVTSLVPEASSRQRG